MQARGVQLAFIAMAAVLLSGCGPRYGRPGDRLERRGDEIVVCGQLFHTGAPVVLWTDPGGYDAYRVENRFDAAPSSSRPTSAPAVNGARYGTLRRHLSDQELASVREEGWTLERLKRHVDLLVLHYDACGTSRRCFEVLHDRRGLSVHFMLDVDGTIYQTLDVKERAWHAGHANDRSVGIEIAGVGAYPPGDETLDSWYDERTGGSTALTLPPAMAKRSGIRTPDFVARPARPRRIAGEIHGRRLEQHDFTNEQYASLARLAATLHRVLPKIEPRYPVEGDGVMTRLMSDAELRSFSGILGHYHVSLEKVDPGPAMDWRRLEREVRDLLP